MDLKKFLELPATGDFRLLNKIDNITDIPVENISLLEPPVEKFVRRHEIILSQALTVRDNETLPVLLRLYLHFRGMIFICWTIYCPYIQLRIFLFSAWTGTTFFRK